MSDDFEHEPTNPRLRSGVLTMGEVIERRLSRRAVLRGAVAVAAVGVAPGLVAGCADREVSDPPAATSFEEIARGTDERHHTPTGHVGDIVIRWGDAIFVDAPAFDPFRQSAEAQARQFGFNNDYVGFIPLSPASGDRPQRALLCVNHEYTRANMMFPDVQENYPASVTAEHCEIEKAAHGGTVLEVADVEGRWRPVLNSKFNRRLTATAPMEATGPAAGHDRMKTSADPEGRFIRGTLNNCAGGITPWGTYLLAEENFDGNFGGDLDPEHPETPNHERIGVPLGLYQWHRFDDRFDVGKEPNEPNRFGWVVEVDPMDPASTPKKRTALGRFKHEGAESVIAPDGRVVFYMGDDQKFEYVYKFVTAKPFDPEGDNRDLLDDGVLHVARFDEDGEVEWMPLVYGQGPLTGENGFGSQADVLIETRRAADLLGATPMDRPEDVEPNPSAGCAYVMLTNNVDRAADRIDAANPRPNNAFGHIIEIIEPDGDFASTRSRWEMLVRCGDPSDRSHGAVWNPLTSANGWFGSPDNCAVDPFGNLWVATDGNEATGASDGVWALATEGAARGTGRAFFRAPVGAEVCGPKFTPDGRTLFVAVQHPGDGRGASFEYPTTRWPDFKPNAPARSAVVAIRRTDGRPITA